jgi:hypothetical protein
MASPRNARRTGHRSAFDEPARWGRGRVVTVLAACTLVVAGIVALGGHQPHSTGPAIRPTTEPPRPADRPVTSTSVALPTGPLLTAPTVSWQLFSGVALPFSPVAGPHRVQPPVYAGYQRSQTGALIAGVQLGTRYLLTGGQAWRDVVARQVAPGVGRDAYVIARARVQLDDPPGSYGQVAGFRILAFSPDVAVLQLVSRFPLTGRLQVTTTTLTWVNGDWQLVLQPDGGSSPTAQAIPDLDGFVVWGGL